MSTYIKCKKLIEKGRFEKVDMTEKLDTFLLNDSITVDEYNELVAMMESKTITQ